MAARDTCRPDGYADLHEGAKAGPYVTLMRPGKMAVMLFADPERVPGLGRLR